MPVLLAVTVPSRVAPSNTATEAPASAVPVSVTDPLLVTRSLDEDPVSAAAGVLWTAGVGERVTAGQPLLELQTDDAARIPRALEALEGAIGIDTGDEPLPLILDRITV